MFALFPKFGARIFDFFSSRKPGWNFSYELKAKFISVTEPARSTGLIWRGPRKLGGRGLKSVENEYKNTKIKAAVKLYCNADPTMAAVRSFEELAVQNGRHSIIKDAKK